MTSTAISEVYKILMGKIKNKLYIYINRLRFCLMALNIRTTPFAGIKLMISYSTIRDFASWAKWNPSSFKCRLINKCTNISKEIQKWYWEFHELQNIWQYTIYHHTTTTRTTIFSPKILEFPIDSQRTNKLEAGVDLNSGSNQ